MLQVTKLIKLLYLPLWSSIIMVGLYHQSRYPGWFTLLTLSAVVLALLLVSKIEKPSVIKATWAALAIAVAMAMPALFSRMPVLSYFWSFYLLAGGFALLAVRANAAKFIFWALVVFTLGDTFFAYYQMLGLGNARPDGLFMDSNARAIYVLATILFLFTQMGHALSRHRAAALWSVLFILMVGFHSTQSRAMFALAILALSLMWVYAGFFDKAHLQNTKRLTAMFVVAFLLYSLIYHLAVDGGSSLRALEDHSQSINPRVDVWKSAWQLIKEHPLVGHGFGLFQFLYPAVRVEMGTAGHFVHNDFLEFWLTSGIPGLVLTLIPVFYFLYKALEAFRMRRFSQLIYSGIGLCLMGYAFFNYFFWRFENLLVLAAVWRLTELDGNENPTPEWLPVTARQKFIMLLLFLLPTASVVAKVDEEVVFRRAGESLEQMHRWSDFILGTESQLIPMRARWYLNQAKQGNQDAIDFDQLSFLISQMDTEIERKTLFPVFYCARAEMGALLGESYDTKMAYLQRGVQVEPLSLYCEDVRFNIEVALGNVEKALTLRKSFMFQKLPMHYADAILILNNGALKVAEEYDQQAFVMFFSRYADYLQQRRIETGL